MKLFRRLLLILTVCLSSCLLFAADEVLTFLWDWNDFNVTKFRYQLDGEIPELWTEVEYYETAATFEGLDLTVPHTLYLQQSYDGILWSQSSTLVSDILEEPVDLFADFVQEEPVEEDFSDFVVSQEAAAPEPVVYNNEVGVKAHLKSYLTKTSVKMIDVGVDFGWLNVWKINDDVKMGIRLVADTAFYPRNPIAFHTVDLAAYTRWTLILSDKLYVGTSAGLELGLDLTKNPVKFGFGGNAGVFLQFQMFDCFSMDLEAGFHILTSEQSFSAGLSICYKY